MQRTLALTFAAALAANHASAISLQATTLEKDWPERVYHSEEITNCITGAWSDFYGAWFWTSQFYSMTNLPVISYNKDLELYFWQYNQALD